VTPLLQVHDLGIAFPRAATHGAPNAPDSASPLQAVRDLNFSIAPGEVLGLVGESGSGKSLTSLAIMRLLPPQARVSGVIDFADNDGQRSLTALSAESMRELRGSRIAMIFQEPMTALNPVMRVGDQIAEAVLAHNRMPKKQAWQRAVDAMNEVAIAEPQHRARDYPHHSQAACGSAL
jgi:ABC-type dipeptide/oligopeptide/nickel transport system ATPase component